MAAGEDRRQPWVFKALLAGCLGVLAAGGWACLLFTSWVSTTEAVQDAWWVPDATGCWVMQSACRAAFEGQRVWRVSLRLEEYQCLAEAARVAARCENGFGDRVVAVHGPSGRWASLPPSGPPQRVSLAVSVVGLWAATEDGVRRASMREFCGGSLAEKRDTYFASCRDAESAHMGCPVGCEEAAEVVVQPCRSYCNTAQQAFWFLVVASACSLLPAAYSLLWAAPRRWPRHAGGCSCFLQAVSVACGLYSAFILWWTREDLVEFLRRSKGLEVPDAAGPEFVTWVVLIASPASSALSTILLLSSSRSSRRIQREDKFRLIMPEAGWTDEAPAAEAADQPAVDSALFVYPTAVGLSRDQAASLTARVEPSVCLELPPSGRAPDHDQAPRPEDREFHHPESGPGEAPAPAVVDISPLGSPVGRGVSEASPQSGQTLPTAEENGPTTQRRRRPLVGPLMFGQPDDVP